MPRLRFELTVTSIDNEPAFDPLWTVGLLNLPKIDGSFKTGFVYNVEKKAQQLYSDLLLAVGAFDRPYLGASSSSGPVYAAPNGWRAENKDEAKERMHKAQMEEEKRRQMAVPFPHPGTTFCRGDWGPPPGFPPEKVECDCGGPKGHVIGGIWCRK